MKKQNKPDISVVVPAFNESKIIQDTAKQLVDVLKKMIKSFPINDYEIIFVDDGSTDNTWSLINKLHSKNRRIKGVSFSRNFGMQAAYIAGLKRARGNYIVMIECDLQDPPQLIYKMFHKLINTKSDVVYGKRFKRNESLYKKYIFNIFHYIFHKTSYINAPQDVGTFSIMNKKALKAFLSFKEKNRYIPGLRYLVGYKQTYIKYKRLDRSDGSPRMNLSRLLKLGFDAIFSFTDFPLKFCLYVGILGVIVSLIVGMYALVSRLLNYNVIEGWSSLLVSVIFLGSIQLVFLGILGQYIYRIYIEVQNRPNYFVADEIR